MIERAELRRMVAQRICYLCRREVADGDGVYWPGFGIVVHDTTCSVILHGELRVYDRSRVGRLRSRREVLARLRTYWRAATHSATNLLRELDALEQGE